MSEVWFADLLDTSVAAVNSALQRARSTLAAAGIAQNAGFGWSARICRLTFRRRWWPVNSVPPPGTPSAGSAL